VEVWLHEFLTSALDGGEWSSSRPALSPGKEALVTTGEEAGWALSEPIWILRSESSARGKLKSFIYSS
jgi:hypothetical protein